MMRYLKVTIEVPLKRTKLSGEVAGTSYLYDEAISESNFRLLSAYAVLEFSDGYEPNIERMRMTIKQDHITRFNMAVK